MASRMFSHLNFAAQWGSTTSFVGLLLTLVTASLPLQANDAERAVEGALTNLLAVGGYWFTSDSARDALGTSKFYRSADFYLKPQLLGDLVWTAGLEYHTATSHALTLVGGRGNDFTLAGPAAVLLTRRSAQRPQQVRPYVSVGLYYGKVRSERIDVKADRVVPGVGLGAQYRIAREVRLNLHYRWIGAIEGINPSGFGVGIQWFF